MKVATEILNQLGGVKFCAMTGSKNFVSGENTLSMTLIKNDSKAKYLTITLSGKDTYDMCFYSLDKNLNVVVKAEKKGLYNSMLQKEFTKVTGLDTHL